ncbi:helix-turn-helix domain-containing protein [Flavobacterium sp. SM15]|uniref:helix-turn-helix domain-containing protein n=1 Tax=Flavobacterium sp. SM15 TaxID=2908005 RepID=UPI001EDB0AD5|nr:helix-turn-helix domain-containing protein [Flavobacterium sp. SM15]MCG2610782.1 helix-turn-helix domain-containing protein [Flavobacterium sp. SM15]
MQSVQMINISPEQLQSEITKGVKAHLDEFLKEFKPKSPEDYLSRSEVAKMLKIDISSLHNWTKKGKLKSYGIGGRVFYKRSDIEAALIPLNG